MERSRAMFSSSLLVLLSAAVAEALGTTSTFPSISFSSFLSSRRGRLPALLDLVFEGFRDC